jgi:hypothetical protein
MSTQDDQKVSNGLSSLEKEEFLIGILLINVTTYFLQDFLVLLFYKTFGLVGQSTLSSFILFFMAFIAIFIYFRAVPKKVSDAVA